MKPIFDCYREIIPEFDLFQEWLHKPLPTHLRINRLKVEPEPLLLSFEEKGIHLERAIEQDDTLYHTPELNNPGNLLEYFFGYVHPQALTSCLAALAVSPREGSYILDMCASPGGKTSYLAQLMNNTGLIVANELLKKRDAKLLSINVGLDYESGISGRYQALD